MASRLNFAGWTKKLKGRSTISVGSVGLSNDITGMFGRQRAEVAGIGALLGRMERGEFDLVAIGRALITDPQWAPKLRTGRDTELLPFDTAALAGFV